MKPIADPPESGVWRSGSRRHAWDGPATDNMGDDTKHDTERTPEATLRLHAQLQEHGPQPELLLKAIGMLDGDLDALRALLAPILTGTALLLNDPHGNLTSSQLETLAAMKDAQDDLLAALDTSRALTVSLQGYWRLMQESDEPRAPGAYRGVRDWSSRRRTRLASAALSTETDELPAFLTADEVALFLDLPLVVVQSIPNLRPIRVNDRYLYRTADVQRLCTEMGSVE